MTQNPRTTSTLANKAGLPPGSLIHVGEIHEDQPTWSLISYDSDHVTPLEETDPAELIALTSTTLGKKWLSIEGLYDVKQIESLGAKFNVHPLVLEDILNTQQRPKFEEYDDYLYIVLKVVTINPDDFGVKYEQISILVFNDLVISFREKSSPLFASVRNRLLNGRGRFRTLGPDYLAYALIDNIIDEYFKLQDRLDPLIEEIEENMMNAVEPAHMHQLQTIRRELIHARRTISPIRELLNSILRSDTPLIDPKTNVYFSDVYDHVIRVLEAIESYRELITGLLDLYLSSISYRMNEIMKVLTIFSTIFIPLTFIVGIYGMNFEFMPELKWKWAYPALWILFAAVAAALLIFFRKKKWI